MRGCIVRTAMVVAAGILAMPAAMRAHDFWIEPSTFHAAPGELIRLALRVGHVLDGDVVVRDASRIERFVVAGPDGEVQQILGQEGTDPAGLLRSARPGTYVIGYRSLPTPHWMEAPGFERYLAEEGLERISELRARRGQQRTPGREIFSRSAKALVTVGDGMPDGHDRRLGLPLELILEVNPATLEAGAPLTVRLLYLGAPLRGALVAAISAAAPGASMSARSDGSGRVTFAAGHRGAWLVKAVHMVPAPPGADAEWESFWASLVFQINR